MHLKRIGQYKFGLFKAIESVKSTRNNNLLVAYCFMAFALEEWEERSYAILSSIFHKVH